MLQVSQNENVLVFVNNALAGPAPFECAWISVIHTFIPIGQHVFGEFGTQMNHSYKERKQLIDAAGL